MKKLGILGAVVVTLGIVGVGQEISGSWTSGLTLGGHGVSLAWGLTLRLAGPGWGITTTFDPALRAPSVGALTLGAQFGAWTLEAGAVVLLPPPSARTFGSSTGPWATPRMVFRSGFVSLELAVGNLTLRLTLHAGSGE